MKRLLQFLGFTFLISWSLMLLKYLAQEEIIPGFFSIIGSLFILGPLLGLIIVLRLDKKNIWIEIKKMFKGKTPKFIYWFVCISPFVLSFLSYLIFILIKGYAFELGMSVQMIVPIALIILITGGPIEEFGWRGYFMPKLREKYSFILTIVIMGIIHGIWHIPLHFIDGTVQTEMSIWEFMSITLLITVSYGLVLEFSKNLLPMILLHWLSNLSSAMFMYWTESTGRYVIFGLTLILDAVLIYYVYKKKNTNKLSTS